MTRGKIAVYGWLLVLFLAGADEYATSNTFWIFGTLAGFAAAFLGGRFLADKLSNTKP